jgi:hypothetical protein
VFIDDIVYEHIERSDPVNQVLLQLEEHTGLGPTFAAELLGIAYSTYAQVRSGRRELQDYTRNHIAVLMILTPEQLEQQIKERVRNGGSKA